MLLLLVCEDEEDFALFREAVDVINIQARCVHALDGEKALALLKAYPEGLPDAIFFEETMTGMTAVECASRIRSNPETGNIQVYVCGDKPKNAAEKEAYRRSGVIDLVMKPTDFAGTVQALRRVLL